MSEETKKKMIENHQQFREEIGHHTDYGSMHGRFITKEQNIKFVGKHKLSFNELTHIGNFHYDQIINKNPSSATKIDIFN